MSNYCEKCKKIVPIIVVGNSVECQVCGTEISDPKKPVKKEAINLVENFCETDPDSGKYKNAQKFGRNIMIGLFIIALGISYSLYGLYTTIMIIVSLVVVLLIASVILYSLIKFKVI